jgi:hypothetical protein
MNEKELKKGLSNLPLLKEANELVAMMVASRKSAKSELTNRKSKIANRKSQIANKDIWSLQQD